MKTKLLIYLALAAAMLTFTAESCFVSTKEVEVPVRGEGDMLFEARGNDAVDGGVTTIDFTELLEDLIQDSEFDTLVSAHIENGYWRVARNGGASDLLISGGVTVRREGSAAPASPMISYTSVSIASALGEFQVAPLNESGVNLLNAGFDEYLQAKALGTTLPDLRFVFTWSSSASPAPPPAIDFDWEGKVKFILVGLTTVDVPEL